MNNCGCFPLDPRNPQGTTPGAYDYQLDCLSYRELVRQTQEALNQLDARIKQLDAGGGSPTGSIVFYAADTPPIGWLECDGREIDRSQYAALFNVIGLTYGPGNGIDSFNLPDLRGVFIRGWDHGRAEDQDREFGSFQGDAIRNMKGWLGSNFDNIATLTGVDGALFYTPGRTKKYPSSVYPGLTGINEIPLYAHFDASRVVPTASDNRPKNVALLPCIKI